MIYLYLSPNTISCLDNTENSYTKLDKGMINLYSMLKVLNSSSFPHSGLMTKHVSFKYYLPPLWLQFTYWPSNIRSSNFHCTLWVRLIKYASLPGKVIAPNTISNQTVVFMVTYIPNYSIVLFTSYSPLRLNIMW